MILDYFFLWSLIIYRCCNKLLFCNILLTQLVSSSELRDESKNVFGNVVGTITVIGGTIGIRRVYWKRSGRLYVIKYYKLCPLCETVFFRIRRVCFIYFIRGKMTRQRNVHEYTETYCCILLRRKSSRRLLLYRCQQLYPYYPPSTYSPVVWFSNCLVVWTIKIL